MAQTSIGFNGSISAAQWAAKAPLLLDGSDALGTPTDLAVTAVSGQRAVSVAAGDIGGDGVVTTLSSAETVTLPTPTNGQWFLLVMNRVWSSGTTSLLLRNGAVTSATFGFLPPASYPASLATNPGTNSDVPVAWLWANSATTNVYIFPLLLPTDRAYPRTGTNATRSATLAPSYSNAPGPWNTYYAQAFWPLWYSVESGEFQQYIGTYDATNNRSGKSIAGWTVVGNQSTPLRYDTEAALSSQSNALNSYGPGGMAYARDTQGIYYLRGDGRRVRLDAPPMAVTENSGTLGSGQPLQTLSAATASRYVVSDSQVFYNLGNGVLRVAVSGWYEISGNIDWDSNSSGNRVFVLQRNDDDFSPVVGDRRVAFNQTYSTVNGIVYLTAGDYIKAKGVQDSGGNLGWRVRLAARLVRPDTP